MHPLKKKRAYDSADKKDGVRILIDRIWPRGVKKEELQHCHWLKDIAPSSDLRKWFGHDSEKYESFKQHYIEELKKEDSKRSAIDSIKEALKDQTVTLIYAAKETEYNHATILIDYIESEIEQDSRH